MTDDANNTIFSSNDEWLHHAPQWHERSSTRVNSDHYQPSMLSPTVTADNEGKNVDYDHEVITNVQTTPSLSPTIVYNNTYLQLDRDGVVDISIGIANGTNAHLLINRIDSVHKVNRKNTTRWYTN